MSSLCLLTHSLIHTLCETFIDPPAFAKWLPIDPLSKIPINPLSKMPLTHFSIHINKFIINISNTPIKSLSNTYITYIY